MKEKTEEGEKEDDDDGEEKEEGEREEFKIDSSMAAFILLRVIDIKMIMGWKHRETEIGKEKRVKETSTPGVQRCVHMLVSLLRLIKYCINYVE